MSSVAPSANAVADRAENRDTSALFEMIPPFIRKPEQVAHWHVMGEGPTHRLLRKPADLKELNDYKYCMAIWRENGTLTYLTPHESEGWPIESSPFLTLIYRDGGPKLTIFGTTAKAIAKTAAYFMNLEKPTDGCSRLVICGYSRDGSFDFRAAGSRCLSRIFQIAPSRPVEFHDIRLTAQQLNSLATRPHPSCLVFADCWFDDLGYAFVDALEKRKSSFGSLKLEGFVGFSSYNLKRLFQLDGVLQELGVSCLDDEDDDDDDDDEDEDEDDEKLVLLPFSTKINRLCYEVSTSTLAEADLESLSIVTSKLALTLHHESEGFPTELLLSFLRRLAVLGHFVELKVRLIFCGNTFEIPNCIVQEITRTALANRDLQVLDLSTQHDDLRWDPHVEMLFEGLKDHAELKTLKLEVEDEALGPDFLHLRQLLSHHRRIRVTDEEGLLYSDGSSIDRLYSLNDFYLGSASLVVVPLSERSSLVATVLTESASGDLQRSALLLSNHTDALYDLVQFSRLAESDEHDSSSQPVQDNTPRRKRRRRM